MSILHGLWFRNKRLTFKKRHSFRPKTIFITEFFIQNDHDSRKCFAYWISKWNRLNFGCLPLGHLRKIYTRAHIPANRDYHFRAILINRITSYCVHAKRPDMFVFILWANAKSNYWIMYNVHAHTLYIRDKWKVRHAQHSVVRVRHNGRNVYGISRFSSPGPTRENACA